MKIFVAFILNGFLEINRLKFFIICAKIKTMVKLTNEMRQNENKTECTAFREMLYNCFSTKNISYINIKSLLRFIVGVGIQESRL